MELIRVIDVNKTYEVDGKEHHALHHFSFDFPKSGLVGIIGKSGSGKSTLLNLISLIDTPTKGDIYFHNENVGKWKQKRKSSYLNKDVGFIFQHYNLIESESVIYNIMLPALIMGKSIKEARNEAILLLKSINFKKELFEQKVYNLSGGEKERVGILRALINNPKLILADEPTGALDSKNSVLVMGILKSISKTKLVIVVSHNIDLIEKYADTLICLKDGKIESITRDNYLGRDNHD